MAAASIKPLGAGPGPRATKLTDLHDDILLHIFKCLHPLPHLFSVARACTRFRRLVGDKRAWLCVVPNPSPEEAALQNPFPTLEAALAAARPGDTIWLASRHHVVSNVTVRIPVHIRGGGDAPGGTCLTVAKGSEVGLDFRATCLLANISVRSSMAPCIVHRCGHLRLERCRLTCMAHGLEHLASPIVTVASSGPATVSLGVAGAASGPVGRAGAGLAGGVGAARTSDGASGKGVGAIWGKGGKGQDGLALKGAAVAVMAEQGGDLVTSSPALMALKKAALPSPSSCPLALAAARRFSLGCGRGRLVVCETQLSGGGQGVHCWGSGALQSVRAIYGSSSLPIFYFEVDSRYPGKAAAGQPLSTLPRTACAPHAHAANATVTAITTTLSVVGGKPGAAEALAGVDGVKLAVQWRAAPKRSRGDGDCLGGGDADADADAERPRKAAVCGGVEQEALGDGCCEGRSC